MSVSRIAYRNMFVIKIVISKLIMQSYLNLYAHIYRACSIILLLFTTAYTLRIHLSDIYVYTYRTKE